MEGLQLRRAYAEQVVDGVRRWWTQVVQTFTITETRVIDYSIALPIEQAAPIARQEHNDAQAYPQRWSPARPGLRAGASLRLASSYGSATRAALRTDAATHLYRSVVSADRIP
jgi:hypothetical protein